MRQKCLIRYVSLGRLKLGVGPMLDPSAPCLPGRWSIDRYVFWMHRCIYDHERYLEFWQLRILWFYIGYGWPITRYRFEQFWGAED